MPRQLLDLDSQRKRRIECVAAGDDSVMRQQAGASARERVDRVIGQFLRAECRIGRAADIGSTGQRHHVVKGRQPAAVARERGGVRRVGVNDRRELGPGCIDVAVEAPLRRGCFRTRSRAGKCHEHEVVQVEFAIGHAGRRDDEPALRSAGAACRDVAGLVDVDAGVVHCTGGVDHRTPQFGAVLRRVCHAA